MYHIIIRWSDTKPFSNEFERCLASPLACFFKGSLYHYHYLSLLVLTFVRSTRSLGFYQIETPKDYAQSQYTSWAFSVLFLCFFVVCLVFFVCFVNQILEEHLTFRNQIRISHKRIAHMTKIAYGKRISMIASFQIFS